MYRIKHRFDIRGSCRIGRQESKSKNRRMYPVVTRANTALLVSIWALWGDEELKQTAALSLRTAARRCLDRPS